MPRKRAHSTELDVLNASASPAVDAWADRLYQAMMRASEAHDVPALANGAAGIDRLIDRLRFVRVEAGRRIYDELPDETYKYRGEERTRKAPWQEGQLRVDPSKVGGGWHRFNYRDVLREVAQRAWKLDTRLITAEGEVVGTVEDVIEEVCRCVSFSNVKADYEKNTGLAKWGLERQDWGEYDDPRLDVRVQRGGDT